MHCFSFLMTQINYVILWVTWQHTNELSVCFWLLGPLENYVISEEGSSLGMYCLGRWSEMGPVQWTRWVLPSDLSRGFPLLLVVVLLTVSEEVLSLVLGSRLGLGGGCLREPQLLSSSVPPTEWRDCDLTEKPVGQGWGSLSWGAGIVMKPMRKCLPT